MTDKTPLSQAADLESRVIKLADRNTAKRVAIVAKHDAKLREFDSTAAKEMAALKGEYTADVRKIAGLE